MSNPAICAECGASWIDNQHFYSPAGWHRFVPVCQTCRGSGAVIRVVGPAGKAERKAKVECHDCHGSGQGKG